MPPIATPTILARNGPWVAIAKPAGMLSIPKGAGGESSARDWLENEIGRRVFTLHRIDRGTSGVLVFALDSDAHQLANGWFSAKQVEKRYEFLALGRLGFPYLTVRSPVIDPERREPAKPAVTRVEEVARLRGAFHGRAEPRTGRRHQIRQHLASEGHPILGDSRYGGPPTHEGISFDRPALHARRIAFPDGSEFEAPLPGDFADWLARLAESA